MSRKKITPRPPRAIGYVGAALGLALAVGMDTLVEYRREFEVAVLTAVVGMLDGYSLWEFRGYAGFRTAVGLGVAAHAGLVAAMWHLLPVRPVLVFGFALVEAFSLVIGCTAFLVWRTKVANASAKRRETLE